MDRITKSLLDEFVANNGLQKLPEDRAFEHFCGYLVTSRHYSESFSTDDIALGAGGDGGIDCISIIVNGCLVTEPEEVADLADTNGFLDVTFVLLQAERSSGFETTKIGQFAYGVQDFVSESPKLPQNDRLKHFVRIVQEVFKRSKLFKKGNPQCLCYYVTTGKWAADKSLSVRRDSAKQDLEGLSLFRNVEFECLGAEDIQKLYRESENAISTEITFSQRVVVPEIEGVEQAYIGLLPSSQFLKLIENDSSEVLTSLFYDNVRHWQEWNPVNTEMKETLSDSHQARLFPLMNNGVTVVAKKITPTANRFVLDDYQVVNGCQTSYVLHECRHLITDDILIPVRLIATQDDSVKNSIIKATNRQTQVSEDQLFALSDFPRKLESFFPTFDGKKKLYYERRSRQYNGDGQIERVRVISMTSLVRSFASFFLERPHGTTRNFRALLKLIGSEIFNKDHRLEPYYLTAFAHYRLDFLFRNQAIDPALKAARYHLLLAYRLIKSKEKIPRMNSHEMIRYCDAILADLWDDDKSKADFELAVTHVRTIANGNLHRDNIRTEAFTEALLKLLK